LAVHGARRRRYFDRRSAQAVLRRSLTDAQRGAIELARTGVTFEQAAIEWLRWGEARARLEALDARRPPLALDVPPAPEFGALPVNQITTRRIEAWKIRWLRRARRAPAGRQAAGDPARDLCSEKRGSRLIERSRMSATGAAVARWIRDPRGSAPARCRARPC